MAIPDNTVYKLDSKTLLLSFGTFNPFLDVLSRKSSVQLKRYETDPYFFQIFQSNTSVCFIISMFCKSCKPKKCEPEMVLKTRISKDVEVR